MINHDQGRRPVPHAVCPIAVAQMTRFGRARKALVNHGTPPTAAGSLAIPFARAPKACRRRANRTSGDSHASSRQARRRATGTGHMAAPCAQPVREAANALHSDMPASIAGSPERWPSGRRRSPAKGVGPKRASWVRIPSSPPSFRSRQFHFVQRLRGGGLSAGRAVALLPSSSNFVPSSPPVLLSRACSLRLRLRRIPSLRELHAGRRGTRHRHARECVTGTGSACRCMYIGRLSPGIRSRG